MECLGSGLAQERETGSSYRTVLQLSLLPRDLTSQKKKKRHTNQKVDKQAKENVPNRKQKYIVKQQRRASQHAKICTHMIRQETGIRTYCYSSAKLHC